MEAKQIKKLYDAMADNGFCELNLELGENEKISMKLDTLSAVEQFPSDVFLNREINGETSEDGLGPEKTQIEIRSDKVGIFNFANDEIIAGKEIKKGETLGTVKGISFTDKIKCSTNGIISAIEIKNGGVVDYGCLLFVVDIDS